MHQMKYHSISIKNLPMTHPQRPMRKSIIMPCLLVIGLTLLSISSSLADISKQTTYKLGAFPMIAAGQVERVFSPVAAELSRILEKKVYLRTKSSFPLYRKELQKQAYDFAIVQPFDYVLASDKYNYLPLARFEKPLFTSFMVLPNSPLTKLEDLKGKRIALPPMTAAVTHMAKKAFLDAGFDLEKDISLKYTKSHDACLQLVMVKTAVTCGSSLRAVHVFQSKWGKHFQVLTNTPSIPNSLFIVHRRVPKEIREQLLQTLISWPESSAIGKQFVKNSNNMRLVPANNQEYDVVRNFPKTTGH